MARETEATARRLRQLKGLGVGLAIDDFGTGYSSLSYLRRFPIEVVKIDKSFVDGIDDDVSARALVRGIVQLAHSLKTTDRRRGRRDRGPAEAADRDGLRPGPGLLLRPADGRPRGDRVRRRADDPQPVGRPCRAGARRSSRSVVADFERLNPGIQVEVVGGATDERIQAALEADDPPTVVSSFESDTFGEPTVGSTARRPRAVSWPATGSPTGTSSMRPSRTRGDERGRWALPVLADTYGLLFNRAAASPRPGSTEPPRTIDELTELAKRLDGPQPGRVAAGRRLRSDDRLLREHARDVRPPVRRPLADATGDRASPRDPAWTRFSRWQKELVDWYGARRPRRVPRAGRRGVLDRQRVPDRPAGDVPRRRVAGRVHRGRGRRSSTTARRRCRSTRRDRSCTDRATSTAA